VPRIEEKIAVDGKLDEAAWQQALVLELPFETEPGENIPAPMKTTVRVFYNKDSICFGLDCSDPDPALIRSRYSERDQFDADDLVNINLDTFNDERRNYFFGCNPWGCSATASRPWAATYPGTPSGIRPAASTTGAIPSSSPFPSPPCSFSGPRPQVWGLDISRWYPRDQRHRLGLVRIDATTTPTRASS